MVDTGTADAAPVRADAAALMVAKGNVPGAPWMSA